MVHKCRYCHNFENPHSIEPLPPQGEICGNCHSGVFKTFQLSKHAWMNCSVCHDLTHTVSGVTPGKLRLINGTVVSEAPFLCRQCHSTQFREWKLGRHGTNVSCTAPSCHNFTLYNHNPATVPPPTPLAAPPSLLIVMVTGVAMAVAIGWFIIKRYGAKLSERFRH